MAKISRFEDLEVWQSARRLVREIYAVSGKGPFGRDFGLRDQIRRAATSAMANIAEGFERGGNKEFLQYLAQAKASTGEVRSHLFAAVDQGYLDSEQFEALSEKAQETSRLAAGLIRYLQRSKLRGPKYQ